MYVTVLESCTHSHLQYLASLAHDLNSQPLPILQETFEVVRLPPAHQRLGEVNFNIVPDAGLTYESEEDDDNSSESDEDEAQTDDGEDGGAAARAEDADGEDEDMEEVDVQEPAVAQRTMDEDYDD